MEMITSLSGIAAMRKRPGMYVGDTESAAALHQLLWEVLSNCVDQYAAGACNTVWLEFGEGNRATIRDDGPGFVDDVFDDVPILTHAATNLHDTASLTGHAPHDHLSPISVGLVVVSAFSTEATIETVRDGSKRGISLAQGKITQPERREQGQFDSGTSISFVPDTQIFGARQFDLVEVLPRLREIAALNPGLKIQLIDRRQLEMFAPDGLAALLPIDNVGGPIFSLNQVIEHHAGQIGAQLRQAKLSVVLRLQRWRNEPSIRCFANQLVCLDGPHRQGLILGLKRPIAKLIGTESDIELCGFDAIVRLQLADPKYRSPTKDILSAPEYQLPIANAVENAFTDWLNLHPELLGKLHEP